MDENELKQCRRMHEIFSSDEESDDDVDTTVQEIYRKYKPPPVEINERRHRIIEIGANGKKRRRLPEPPKKSSPSLSKSQKKRLRRNKSASHGGSSKEETSQVRDKINDKGSLYYFEENLTLVWSQDLEEPENLNQRRSKRGKDDSPKKNPPEDVSKSQKRLKQKKKCNEVAPATPTAQFADRASEDLLEDLIRSLKREEPAEPSSSRQNPIGFSSVSLAQEEEIGLEDRTGVRQSEDPLWKAKETYANILKGTHQRQREETKTENAIASSRKKMKRRNGKKISWKRIYVF